MKPGTSTLLAFCICLLAAGVAAPLFAELPPSVYEERQKAAPELVEIEVIRVDIEPGQAPDQQNIAIVALVNDVKRTSTNLQAGQLINIQYIITDRPKDFVGPGEIPLLEEGHKGIAYLVKHKSEDSYVPAAGIMSFSNF